MNNGDAKPLGRDQSGLYKIALAGEAKPRSYLDVTALVEQIEELKARVEKLERESAGRAYSQPSSAMPH